MLEVLNFVCFVLEVLLEVLEIIIAPVLSFFFFFAARVCLPVRLFSLDMLCVFTWYVVKLMFECIKFANALF